MGFLPCASAEMQCPGHCGCSRTPRTPSRMVTSLSPTIATTLTRIVISRRGEQSPTRSRWATGRPRLGYTRWATRRGSFVRFPTAWSPRRSSKRFVLKFRTSASEGVSRSSTTPLVCRTHLWSAFTRAMPIICCHDRRTVPRLQRRHCASCQAPGADVRAREGPTSSFRTLSGAEREDVPVPLAHAAVVAASRQRQQQQRSQQTAAKDGM